MSNLTTQDTIWLWITDAARILALAHQQPLARNPQGHIQPATLTRLQRHCRLVTPNSPQLTREVDAPHLSFLVHILLKAQWLVADQSPQQITCADITTTQLQSPLPLLLHRLRSVWWKTLLQDLYTLPALALSPGYKRRWRALILATCAMVAQLPTGTTMPVHQLLQTLLAAGYLTPPGNTRHLPAARRAFQRQAEQLVRFVICVCLQDLGLVTYVSAPHPIIQTTAAGQQWLQAALAQQQLWEHPPAGAAVEMALPLTAVELTPLSTLPLKLYDDLHFTLALQSPPALTFAAYHFAQPQLPHPPVLTQPAHYILTRQHLAQGVLWEYPVSEVLLCIGQQSGGEVSALAWAQLQRWQQQIHTIRYEPGYHLQFPPAILSDLWSRRPFRHRVQRNHSQDTVWVSQTEAPALFRYLRRRGYTLQVQDNTAPAPPTAPAHAGLPLSALLLICQTYQALRQRLPDLARADVALVIRNLECALAAQDRAAVAQMLESQNAILTRALDPILDVGTTELFHTRIEEAITTRTPLLITYVDTHAQRTQRQVHPLRLETHWDHTYLVARCDLRGEERHFRLDRIVAVEDVVKDDVS